MTSSNNRHGSSQADVRQRNRRLALAMVAQRRSATRGDLAEAMGLSRPAVSRIVADLVDAGLLAESDARRGAGPGRPTGHLSLPSGQHLFFGVDIRLEGVLIQARDLAGTLVAESRHALARTANPEMAVDLLAGEISAHCARLNRRADGVGLAVGAHQDESNQLIIESPYRDWRMVPLPRLLAERLGQQTPVLMSDVASCAALANWQELASDPELNDLIHLQIGIGAGSGLIQRRQGVPHVAVPARIAHIPLQAGGHRCAACGARGCFDAMAGFPALVARASATGLTPIEGPQMIDTYCTDLRLLADHGNGVAVDSIEEMATWFAHAAAIVINIWQPSRFTYAGYPVLLGPAFHRRFTDVLSDYVQDVDGVLASTALGDRASVTGAYWLATSRLMADPEGERRPTSAGHPF